jgi:prepilin peptidase CpaA
MVVFALLGLGICLVAAVTDLARGVIPNALTLPVLAAAPAIHAALALLAHRGTHAAMAQAGWSLLGAATCVAVPLLLWRFGSMGGGDVKLLAALGALFLPRVGFEIEMNVFVAAALFAPIKLAYDGTLLRVAGNLGFQVAGPVLPRAWRRPRDPSLATWFRLGPCFVLGLGFEFFAGTSPW